METPGTRVAAGLIALLVLWVVVYWLWQPGTLTSDPDISFSDRPRPQAMAEAQGPRPDEGEPRPPIENPLIETVRTPASPTVIAPRFRDYTVRPGDTFEEIARRELGARSLSGVVAQANPLRDPRRLRPGDIVRIPIDPRNIQGTTADGSTPPAPDPITPADETSIVYLVKSGDSLSSIAQAYYGSQGFSELIFRNNRDVLDSMDDLSIGMQLRLPPVPAEN
ncbi:MAG: hypothetical protein DHS20C14_20660 [Phycisphaeraceae bacterium]|nr:MAG: hypothetical protein DHS20C14_20660 [Phycisphaeraceae bacterium]